MSNQSTFQLRQPANFSRVFDTYFGSLCLYAQGILESRADAEDVVTNLFAKLWGGVGEFNDEEHLKAYLYRGVKNESLKVLRDKVRHANGAEALQKLIERVEAAHVHEIIRREVVRELHAAIAQLRPDEREIITMCYLEGKSNQEVADALGLALQTVKNKKIRALSSLRKLIPDNRLFMLFLLFNSFYFVDY